MTRSASAIGLATYSNDVLLDAWYPQPSLGTQANGRVDVARGIDSDAVRGTRTTVIRTDIPDLDAAPVDAADAYLRLHLLSHRLVTPRSINLDGIFGLLQNVAWTSLGPIALDRLSEAQLNSRQRGVHVMVTGVDKFPRMVDYVVPTGVRIADADRVHDDDDSACGFHRSDRGDWPGSSHVTSGSCRNHVSCRRA
mgnify:CR=1 FL=1